MLFSNPTRRTIARLLLVWFALMQVNAVVFRHAHRLSNGRIITHAHPFWPDGKGPVQPNPHTSGELALLDAVSNGSFTLDIPAVFDFQVLEPVSFVTYFYVQPPTVTRPFFCFSQRGPPLSFVTGRLA